MSGDRITVDELRYLSIFEELTGAVAFRCVEDEENNRLFFVVRSRDVGRAIGRGGRNIKVLSRILNRGVEVVEYSEDLEGMVKNLFPGISILRIDISGRGGEKSVVVWVKEEDKGRAIGRGGRNIKRARIVLNRLFGVSRVSIR